MPTEPFPVPFSIVVAVLVLFSILYQLNARVTPWATWHERANGGYLRSSWSYAVLNWTSTVVVLGLILVYDARFAVIGLELPRVELGIVLAAIYLAMLVWYYRDVVARPPLDEQILTEHRDGWTPATRCQRLVGIFLFSLTPGICEEIVYRGFALSAFLSFGFSPWVAVGLATVPYVLLHGTGAFESIQSFGHYASLGIVFSFLFLRAEAIWPAIVAHATYNLLVTVRNTRDYQADPGVGESEPAVKA